MTKAVQPQDCPIKGAQLLIDQREFNFLLSALSVPASTIQGVLAVAKKTWCIEGIVESITRQRNGKIQVCIGSNAQGKPPSSVEDITLRNYFYSDDFGEGDLDEFKRAQNHKLCVKVCFDENRNIVQLTVFYCDHPYS